MPHLPRRSAEQRQQGGGACLQRSGLHLKVEIGPVEAGDRRCTGVRRPSSADDVRRAPAPVAVAVKAPITGRRGQRCQKVRDLADSWAGNPAPTGRCSGPRPPPAGEMVQRPERAREKPSCLQPLRGDIDELVGPRTRPLVDRRGAAAGGQGGVDIGRRDARVFAEPATWSFISEMSGDTTSVTPGSISAGT